MTLINSVGSKTGRTIVFTAYRLQLADASESKENWYPTVYFYDLEKNEVNWKIYGAEIFVSIDDKDNVMLLTN